MYLKRLPFSGTLARSAMRIFSSLSISDVTKRISVQSLMISSFVVRIDVTVNLWRLRNGYLCYKDDIVDCP